MEIIRKGLLTIDTHNKVTTICGRYKGRRAGPKPCHVEKKEYRGKYTILFSLMTMNIYIQIHMNCNIIQTSSQNR